MHGFVWTAMIFCFSALWARKITFIVYIEFLWSSSDCLCICTCVNWVSLGTVKDVADFSKKSISPLYPANVIRWTIKKKMHKNGFFFVPRNEFTGSMLRVNTVDILGVFSSVIAGLRVVYYPNVSSRKWHWWWWWRWPSGSDTCYWTKRS